MAEANSEAKSVILCLPKGTPLFDPGPEVSDSRNVTLTDRWDENVQGIIGWSSGGWAALALAAQNPDLPRLVIISTPFPQDDEPAPTVDLDAVAAKTLLLFGSKDPQTGSRHGRSWQKRLPNARLEMVPGGDHDLLVPMWSRVLSHLTPRASHRAPGR